MTNYLEQFGRSSSRYPKLYGGDVKKHYEKAKKNPAIRLIFVILMICLVIYLLYSLWKYLLKKQKREQQKCDGTEGCLLFEGVKNASRRITLDKDKMDNIVPSAEYGVSTWLYVQSSNFGHSSKNQLPYSTIYALGQKNPQESVEPDYQNRVQPGVWISNQTNSLMIKWDTSSRTSRIVPCCDLVCNKDAYGRRCSYNNNTYVCGPSSDHGQSGALKAETSSSNSQNPTINNQTCEDDHCMIIPNIPLERWFHLVVTVTGASIDVYVDGKLIKTKVLASRPTVLSKPSMMISGTGHTHDYGFQGYITQHRYFNIGLSSYDVLSIYSKGPDPFHILSPKQFAKKYL